MTEEVVGYKGFNSDWTCRGFQYKVGETYTSNRAVVCDCGFHFCKDPLDVLSYYPPIDEKGLPAKYARVAARGVSSVDAGGSKTRDKFSAKEITVLQEISFSELLKYARNSKKRRHKIVNTDRSTLVVATKEDQNAVADALYTTAFTVDAHSKAITLGDRSVAISDGACSQAIALGRDCFSVSTGDGSQAKTSGVNSSAVSFGGYSDARTFAGCAHAITLGCVSMCSVNAPKSIAASFGMCSSVSGVIGSYLVFAEWDQGFLKGVYAVKVDGKRIKPKTFYRVVGGKWRECP